MTESGAPTNSLSLKSRVDYCQHLGCVRTEVAYYATHPERVDYPCGCAISAFETVITHEGPRPTRRVHVCPDKDCPIAAQLMDPNRDAPPGARRHTIMHYTRPAASLDLRVWCTEHALEHEGVAITS